MATISENIQGIITSKENIRQAINGKGGTLGNGAKLSEFAEAVSNLSGGGLIQPPNGMGFGYGNFNGDVNPFLKLFDWSNLTNGMNMFDQSKYQQIDWSIFRNAPLTTHGITPPIGNTSWTNEDLTLFDGALTNRIPGSWFYNRTNYITRIKFGTRTINWLSNQYAIQGLTKVTDLEIADYINPLPNGMNYSLWKMTALSYDSLINFLNLLPTVTTSMRRTLTLHTNHNAMLSDADRSIATSKNWTITTTG